MKVTTRLRVDRIGTSPTSRIRLRTEPGSGIGTVATFDGDVISGADYLLVVDFVRQGGTLANLKGFIETNGGRVIGATVLTGKSYSAILNPSNDQLISLRAKHGKDLEQWWTEWFGHGFDRLTQSEARYLERSPGIDTIRSRIAEEEQAGNCGPL